MPKANTTTTNGPDQFALMAAKLAALQAENEALKASKSNGGTSTLTVKTGQKGGVSVYGFGKFPVTLYGNAWERLIGELDNPESQVRATILEYAGDAQQGAISTVTGRPVGSAAHQQRVRDAEVRAAKRAS